MKSSAAKMTENVADTMAGNVEYATFDTAKAADQFRSFAEKGAEQSKEAYARIKTGTETAQKALGASFESAKSASSDLSMKSIAAMRSASEAAYAHLEALVGAKSLSDMIELQGSFLRQRFEAAVEQGKEFQAVTSKAAEDMSRPLRDVFTASVKELKVA